MANMMPSKPRECSKNSLEDVMFEALYHLPDEYYVFHSFKIITIRNDLLQESETDFVVFNPAKGILCLEAKAGHVYCKDEEWFYGSGIKMSHEGPYRQAASNKWKLMQYISDKNMDDIKKSCKFVHGVWFPSVSDEELKQITFPSDGDRAITMTSEALSDPQKYIDKLFSVKIKKDFQTDLSGYQIKRILNSILCPSFNLIPSVKNEYELKRIVFNRMIGEQVRLLDYLEEQPVAVINGVAGSGKTLIALEKARRCAEKGEKVLFLCYNRFLRDYLKESYKYNNVSFYTIDGLSCKLCGISIPDIKKLSVKLEELFVDGKFPYKNIIIDEGQDFGKSEIEETQIIELLESIVLHETINGTFYVFYDKLQLVQGDKIPKYIQDADCRLSLYKNCRNTENIAITSMRPLRETKKPKLFEGALKGDAPKLYVSEASEDNKKIIDDILQQYQSNKIDDVVILTCKTETNSILSKYIQDGKYKYKRIEYTFTTCRKFKGLEADVILLVDVDKGVFLTDAINIYYVGTSRARFALNIVAKISSEDCAEILESYGKTASKRPEKALASFLNAKYEKR